MKVVHLIDSLPDNQVVSTAILFAVVVVMRIFANRYLRLHPAFDIDQKRRIKSNVRNALLLLVAVGLFFIWAPALRTFALSLTAFAVAIILATKEVILCLSGSLVKATSRSMRIGDWISVGHVRGEVIDQDLISTTVQELGVGPLAFEFTGKTVVVPNSLFLNTAVVNERFYKHYVIHEIGFVTDHDIDPAPVLRAMREVVAREMADALEVTRRYKSKIESRAGITLPDIDGEPRVLTTREGRLNMMISCFLPTKLAVAIEQKALLAGMANVRAQRESRPARASRAE